MNSLNPTIVTRKAEDRSAEPGGIGGITTPSYGGSLEGHHNDLRAARKKG